MLDFPRYRIQPPTSDSMPALCEILRPETGEQVGVVKAAPPGRLDRLLPRLLRRRQLEVREYPEPALVFRILWPMKLVDTGARVCDALDDPVGYFSRTPNSRTDAFEIYLARLVRLAFVSGSSFDPEFHFVTAKGQHLAQVSRPLLPSNMYWIVDMDDCLEHEPIIKMLLLAAVLVLALDNSEW